jgi:chemotaxis protein histidine kinase CheA
MNRMEMSHQQFMEELLSLEALLRLMKGREPSEWMINNVMSLLYSLKTRASLARKLPLADIVHFMQKVLIELPFHAALDLLLEAVDVCVRVFDDATAHESLHQLRSRYEEFIRTRFAPAGTVVALRRS